MLKRFDAKIETFQMRFVFTGRSFIIQQQGVVEFKITWQKFWTPLTELEYVFTPLLTYKIKQFTTYSYGKFDKYVDSN